MDVIFSVGIALLGISVALMWWRIFLPLAVSLLISWLVAKFTPLDSVWFTYPCLALGLLLGAAWHRESKRPIDASACVS
jgi:hypothetical protein